MLLSLLLASTLPQTAPQHAPLGRETVITFAAGGTLRDWERGEARDILYVRDRNEQWYRITTSGPCPNLGGIDTLSYTTDGNGTFDRFSRLRFLRYPGVTCGVRSIVTSLPPPAKQGSRKAAKR